MQSIFICRARLTVLLFFHLMLSDNLGRLLKLLFLLWWNCLSCLLWDHFCSPGLQRPLLTIFSWSGSTMVGFLPAWKCKTSACPCSSTWLFVLHTGMPPHIADILIIRNIITKEWLWIFIFIISAIISIYQFPFWRRGKLHLANNYSHIQFLFSTMGHEVEMASFSWI